MGFATLRVDQLAEKCRERGLPDKGSKSSLLAVLRADERVQQELAGLQYSRDALESSESEYEPTLEVTEPEEEKYPPLSPLRDPKGIFMRLVTDDLEEICEQNDTVGEEATTQDWSCLSVQAKYRDKAEAAQQRRDEAIKQAMAVILEDYAKDMAVAEQGLKKEMCRFGEDNMAFARKKMNWTYAYEELEARKAQAAAAAAAQAEAESLAEAEFLPRSRSPYRYSPSPSYSSRSKSSSPPEQVLQSTVQPHIRQSPSISSESSFIFPSVPAYGTISVPAGPAKAPTVLVESQAVNNQDKKRSSVSFSLGFKAAKKVKL